MNLFSWTLFYIFGALMHIVYAEIFSSVYKLSILAREEGKLLRAFQKYIEAKTKEGKHISFELRRLINDLEPMVSDSCTNPSYAENPINSFHLISRFVYKWPVVYSNLLCEHCEIDDHARYLNTTFAIVDANIVHWPGEYDVKATADALLRLRIFYYFDIDALIDGRLINETVLPLNPSQVLKIVKIAEESNMLNEAKLWCEAIIRRLPFNSYLDESVNYATILKLLAGIYYKAGMPGKAAEILSEMRNAGHSDINRDFELYKKLSNRTQDVEDFPLVYEEYDGPYKQLCRSELKDPRKESYLYCYFSNTYIPYYKGKVEVMNWEPRIVIFHDVLSDTDAADLREQGSKKFEMSTVMNKNNLREVADTVRVSQTAWLLDSTYENVEKTTYKVGVFTGLSIKYLMQLSHTEAMQIVNYGIGGMYHPHLDAIFLFYRAWVFDTPGLVERTTKRVGLFTDLATKFLERASNAEAFQVVNYGIGGMYHPHLDRLNIPIWGPINTNDAPELQGSGDRIATWMYYLNDVTAGGATVFPEINTRVPVIKGAAAFWYNLLPSGLPDNRTLHAGCPVIIGSKWIANKWIRESGQMFTRPCALEP